MIFKTVADVFKIASPENDQQFDFTEDATHAITAAKNGYEVTEYVTLERYQQAATVPDLSALDRLAGEMLNHSLFHKGKVAEAYALCAHRIAETVRDCRAAMQSEPVIGWIKCSERMPEPSNCLGGTEFSMEVLTIDQNGCVEVDYVMYPHGIYGHDRTPRFAKNGYGKRDVTHWMPLPAAPEQGV